MRNHLVVAALAILAAVAGGAALALWTEDGDTPAGVSGGDCDPAVQRSLDAWGGRGFSGSVAVSREGRFECVASLGAADAATGRPNTADTVFSIGSVSKSFAAAAVLKLAAAGRLRLSDRAGGLLPGLEGGARRVTVEQLLTHTSGLPVSHADDTQPMRRDEAVAAISGLRLAFRPGSGFLYSNAGYTLLALIVDEVSRTEYRRYLTAEVLTLTNGDRVGGFWNGEPAAPGERAIGYTERGRSDEQGDLEGPHWALTGNGDLAMSARALAVWTHALFAGDLLPARLLRTMTEGGFTRDDGGRSTAGWVRFDANVYGVPLVVSTGGGGSGQQAIVLWSPRTRQVIAAVSNRPEIGAVDLVRAIGPALLGGEPVPLPPRPGRRVDPRELADVAGTYALPSGGSLEARPRAGGLTVRARGRDAVEVLMPIGDAFDAGTVAAHERQVVALLRGDTDEGREERGLLESRLGPIATIRVEGTITDGRELQTYVTVTTPAGRERLWYALDERGGISAAESSAQLPAARVVPLGSGRFELEDPTGTRTPVTLRFDDETMTIESIAGLTTARRIGGGGP